MKNIIENNKLIAEFMGCNSEEITLFKDEIDKNGNSLEVTHLNWDRPPFFTDSLYKAYGWGSYSNEVYMLYESSWDWLMPVVEKCLIGEAEQHSKARILINKIYENLCSINITGTYKEVIEFIKWHNEQNK